MWIAFLSLARKSSPILTRFSSPVLPRIRNHLKSLFFTVYFIFNKGPTRWLKSLCRAGSRSSIAAWGTWTVCTSISSFIHSFLPFHDNSSLVPSTCWSQFQQCPGGYSLVKTLQLWRTAKAFHLFPLPGGSDRILVIDPSKFGLRIHNNNNVSIINRVYRTIKTSQKHISPWIILPTAEAWRIPKVAMVPVQSLEI